MEDDAAALTVAEAAALQEALDAAHAAGGAGATLVGVVIPGRGVWRGAAGDLDGAAPRFDDPFRIGSITKTFGAVVALRLATRGVLDLDAPVGADLPWLEGGDGITTRHLLTHRSGIADYTDTLYFVGHWGEPISHQGVVELATDLGPAFPPGERSAYSNTGYYALALAVEARTGVPWHAWLRDELEAPLGLRHTWLEGMEDPPVDARPLVPHYVGGQPPPPFDPSWHWAAGGLISTVDDLLTWGTALLDGDVATADERALLAERPQQPDGSAAPWGHGLAFDDDTPCGPVVGHTGSTMGFQSDLFRTDDGVIVVALQNDFLVEVSDAAWAVGAVAQGFIAAP